MPQTPQDQARRDAFFCAALTGILAAPRQWGKHSLRGRRHTFEPYEQSSDFVEAAGIIADEALKQSPTVSES